MKEQLTWKDFVLLQPALVFYAYLVVCFFDATIHKPPYVPRESPFSPVWLIFIVPSALLLGLLTHVIGRKYLCSGREIILLFILVPVGSAMVVQLLFVIVSSILRLTPAG